MGGAVGPFNSHLSRKNLGFEAALQRVRTVYPQSVPARVREGHSFHIQEEKTRKLCSWKYASNITKLWLNFFNLFCEATNGAVLEAKKSFSAFLLKIYLFIFYKRLSV